MNKRLKEIKELPFKVEGQTLYVELTEEDKELRTYKYDQVIQTLAMMMQEWDMIKDPN